MLKFQTELLTCPMVSKEPNRTTRHVAVTCWSCILHRLSCFTFICAAGCSWHKAFSSLKRTQQESTVSRGCEQGDEQHGMTGRRRMRAPRTRTRPRPRRRASPTRHPPGRRRRRRRQQRRQRQRRPRRRGCQQRLPRCPSSGNPARPLQLRRRLIRSRRRPPLPSWRRR